jgi:error-prone DNA polymerase
MWAMMMSFAGYSFCKPHSASYAQVSFKSAFLRAHYPAEFIAAVISNQGGYYSAFAYLSEGRRMGLTVLPPDINASEWGYTGSGHTVRVGLMQIKSLQEAFVRRMVIERQLNGLYRSLPDVLDRVKPDMAQATLLIKAGCLDSIAGELTRPALLWRLWATQATTPPGYIPIPPEYSAKEKRTQEWRLFGFPLQGHPLDLYKDVLERTPHCPAADLAQHVGEEVTVIGWLITEKIISTKNGDPMEFVTFEDHTALYDATLFPQTYRQCCHLLAVNQAYVVRGLVEEQFSTVTLTVRELRLLASHEVNTEFDTIEEVVG